jgi:DNA/RNA-binding domain of Phe-tRNA-synthetase-like protein
MLSLTLPIRAAYLVFEGLIVSADDDAAHKALEGCAQRYRDQYCPDGPAAPSAVVGVQHARELFRALHIDPTKHRPSSEALLRRALQDKPMPHINTLVDVGNYCSLDFLLPLGIYDQSKIRGDITLRLGEEGERYDAIGNKTLNLAGRYVLADDRGPFGTPMTDSLRTATSTDTTAAVIIIYATLDFDEATFRAHAQTHADRVTEYCGGHSLSVRTLAGD